MAGELTIKDWSGDNVGNANLGPNVCLDIDAANSTNVVTAVKLATQTAVSSTNEVIGVCYDQAKLDPNGVVVPSSGLAVRTWGVAKVQASGPITAGKYVAVSNSSGQVAQLAQTAAGSQPVPIVGRALNSTTASGDLCLVLLMIGGRI